MVELRQAAHDSVLSAAGVPAALFSARSDATGAREALRQFLHSTLQPLAALVAVEARAKLDPGVTFDFSRLMAADIQGKARSAKALVDAGFSLEQAAAMAGFYRGRSDERLPEHRTETQRIGNGSHLSSATRSCGVHLAGAMALMPALPRNSSPRGDPKFMQRACGIEVSRPIPVKRLDD